MKQVIILASLSWSESAQATVSEYWTGNGWSDDVSAARQYAGAGPAKEEMPKYQGIIEMKLVYVPI